MRKKTAPNVTMDCPEASALLAIFARLETAQAGVSPGPGRLAFSIANFCLAADLGRSFVYGEIAAGHLQAVKAGGRTLILAPEAARYLEELPSSLEIESPAAAVPLKKTSAPVAARIPMSKSQPPPKPCPVGRAQQPPPPHRRVQMRKGPSKS